MAIQPKQINISTNQDYIIIARKLSMDGKNEIVLGYSPDKGEYVTWWVTQGIECYSGHYFRSIQDAVEDYTKRE